MTTFYRRFAQKPSKVEVLDGLNGEADGILTKGSRKYETVSPTSILVLLSNIELFENALVTQRVKI